MPAVLGYWKIRGLAQPIRLLLHYAGEDYKDELYEITGSAPNWNMEAWSSKKFTLGLDFPNLPYYIDGDVKISQSLGVLNYVAAKHKLNGKTLKEQGENSMLNQELADLRAALVKISYNPDFQNLKPGFLETLPTKLKQFSDFLKDKQFLVGAEIVSADFNLYDFLDVLKHLEPNCLDKYSNLQEYIKRIENLPKIKAYMSSPSFISWPINNKMAAFGAGPKPN